MLVINIQARCPNTRAEFQGQSAQEAELAIESLISVALLELCGEVYVDAVSVCEEQEEQVVPLAERAKAARRPLRAHMMHNDSEWKP